MKKHEQDIGRALAHLQRARTELNDACAALSTVRGCVGEWETLAKLSDRVNERAERVSRIIGDPTLRARFAKLNPEEV